MSVMVSSMTYSICVVNGVLLLWEASCPVMNGNDIDKLLAFSV